MTQQNLEVLQRALIRLASMNEEQFEQNVGRVLPNILPMLANPEEQVKKLVIEILSHISKRLRAHPSIALPLPKLIQIFNDSSSAFLTNFALLFLDLGFHSKSVSSDHLKLHPKIIRGLGRLTPVQQTTVLHVFLTALAHVECPRYKPESETSGDQWKFLSSTELRILADFCREVMLLVPRESAEQKSDESTVPPGMSLASHKRATNSYKLARTPGNLARIKLAVVAFVAHSGVLEPNERLPILLVASCDPSEPVANVSGNILKKMDGFDLNNVDLVGRLMRFFLGSQPTTSAPPTASQCRPANPQQRLAVMAWLLRSEKAANSFPLTLRILFECLFGKNSFSRLKSLGLDFANWIISKAGDSQISGPIARIIKDGIEKLVKDEPSGVTSADAARMRESAYSTLGRLSERRPMRELWIRDLKIVDFLFVRLASEGPATLPGVHAALSAFAAAYEGARADVKREMKAKLLETVENSEIPRVRVSALSWLTRLFPFSDCDVRLACLMNCNDSNEQVRSEARHGCQPTRLASRENSLNDECRTPVPFPDFGEFVELVHRKLNVSNGKRLDVSAYVLEQVIAFCLRCLKHNAKAQNCTESEIISRGSSGALQQFLGFIDCSFDGYKTTESDSAALHARAATALTHLLTVSAPLRGDYAERTKWLTRLLYECGVDARGQLADILGLVGPSMPHESLLSLISDISSVAAKQSSESLAQCHGAILGVGALCRALRAGEHADSEVSRAVLTRATTTVTRALNVTEPALGLLRAAACRSVGWIGEGGPMLIDGDTDGPKSTSEIISRLQELAGDSARHREIAEFAVKALGDVAIGTPAGGGELDQIREALLSLSRVRHVEIHFAVGLALAKLANRKSEDGKFSQMTIILMKILSEILPKGNASARQLCALALISIIQFDPSNPEILRRAEDLQNAFVRLLTDSRTLTQESACKGLAVLYEFSPKTLQDTLLSALALSFGRKSENATENGERVK
eukprot:725502_1